MISIVRHRLFSLGLCILCLLITSCAKPPAAEGPKEDLPKSAEVPKPTDLPPASSKESMPPPTIEGAQRALARVYNDVVSLDPARNKTFIVGDFNGDGYQDIALIVRPNKEKLTEINSEVANWIIKDALVPKQQRPALTADPHARPTRPTIGESDAEVLAVIHGFGPKGWLSDDARQSYLVRNAAGQDLKTVTKDELIADSGTRKPPLAGDVIKETLSGAQGFIYYTGATYAWFNPKTSEAEPAKRPSH